MTHGILLCDKPRGLSSHTVVAMVRKAFGTKDVGHAGTLDPMATGLLVVGIGEGLKILRYLTSDDKRYIATLRLGVETDSLDADGCEVARAELPRDLTLERVTAACSGFIGELDQVPPAISAIKQDGVPMYKRARRGEAVVLTSRRVRIDRVEVSSLRDDELDLVVDCGKGFYVRSFARDLAHALGTLGHLAALRRLRSGSFCIDGAVSVEDELRPALREPERSASLRASVLPIEAALAAVPRVVLDELGAEHIRHGRAVPLERVLSACPPDWAEASPVEPVLLCTAGGELLALGRWADDSIRVVRGFRFERS